MGIPDTPARASPSATRYRSGDTLAPTVRPGRGTRFWLGGALRATRPTSPVADALGLTRRCQRSTCVTAVLPAPMRGRKNSFLHTTSQQGLHDAENRNTYRRNAYRRLVQTSTERGDGESDNGQCERHPLPSLRTPVKCLVLNSLAISAVFHFLLKCCQKNSREPL